MKIRPTPMSADQFDQDSPTDVTGEAYPTKTLLVGSDPGCDVFIDHPSVSPCHINFIALSNGQYMFEDLGSDEGTFVQGFPETKGILETNDVIQLGRHPIEVSFLISHFDSDGALETEETAIVESKTELIIGSSPEADIVLPVSVISPKHAKIELVADGLNIDDIHSDFGTFVNGFRIYSKTKLRLHDRLMLGGYPISRQMLRSWWKQLAHSEQRQHRSNINAIIPENGDLLLGRSPECDITVDHPTVSWFHARLSVRDGVQEIVDLKSANGTYVDDLQVERSLIRPKSRIRLGAARFDLSGLNQDNNRITQEIRISAQSVTRRLKNGTVLLDKIALSIYPGEMVALMGPSGAGKTTLLEVLSGKKQPEEGQVLLNDKDIYDAWEEFRHTIGYVPQDDVLHRDLTVFEVLFHATRLRLPADVPTRVINEQVNLLMTRMGLAHVRDSLIGDENIRGISGGQRKRVNIAIELITEPSLLFLDEPTSGLDAKSTLEVMHILRELASSGKTVIMTIHQPRLEAFELLDNLILMTTGGKLAYYGPASQAEGYIAKTSGRDPKERGNPADFVIDALESPKISPDQWQSTYLESGLHKTSVSSRMSSPKPLEHDASFFIRPFFSQFYNLFVRYTKRKLRDRYALLIQLAQAPVIGVILGLLFEDSGEEFRTMDIPASLEKIPVLIDLLQLQNGIHATLFLIGAASFWLGCSNVARELVSERAIFLRERRAGLRPLAYLSAIWMYQLLLCAAQTLLICGSVVFFINPSADFGTLWPILILSAASGIAVGLVISAWSKTEVAAISFIPIILIPQLMLAGYIKLYGMLREISWQLYSADLMPIRWAFEALAVVEYRAAQAAHPHLHDLSAVIGFEHLSLERPIQALVSGIFLFLFVSWIRLYNQE